MALVGSTNEEKIWNFLKSAGMNDYAASGVMGNLYAESNLNPINLQNTYEQKLGYSDIEYCNSVDDGEYQNFENDNAAWGLAQWKHRNRKKGLLNYAKQNGASIGDLETQLNYLIHELNESYKNVVSVLHSSQSVREASDVILLKFEIPSNRGESVQIKRAEYGQKYFDKYSKLDDTSDENLGLGDNRMKIKVNLLIDLFEKMYNEHWSYIWGIAKKGCVDCSGAFVYAYKTLSDGKLSIYHGSNRIARKHVKELQTIDHAKPGYIAFKWKENGAPITYTDNKGNYYHVGLVDKSGEYVLNAKSVTKGFCKDHIKDWDFVAELIDVDYSVGLNSEDSKNEKDANTKFFSYVDTKSGNLNLRIAPNGKKIGTIPRTVLVDVIDDSNPDWWYIKYDQLVGYASTDFLMRLDDSKFPYDVDITVNSLNMRSGAGKNYRAIGKIRNGGRFTIVGEADGKGASKWGKLKFNGAWISLDYTKKV